jgi:iron-sulfur cluster assembly protein
MGQEHDINITERAAEAIRKQLIKRNTPDAYVRLGVRGSGCSGFEYVFRFEDDPPREKDLLLQFGNIKVVIDPKSIIYLSGTTLDWESSLLKQGFIFRNPRQKSMCGCGKSFSV